MSNKQSISNLSTTYADMRKLNAKIVDAKQIKLNGENIENLWGFQSPKDFKKLCTRCELPEDANYILYDDLGSPVYISFIDRLINGTRMFYYCSNLTSFSGDLSSLTNGNSMFYYCSNLTSFTSDLSSLTNGNNMFSGCSNLTSFTSDLSSLVSGTNMFSSCSNLASFASDLSSLTNGKNMFYYCSNLSSFSGDLSSLKDGTGMFGGCKLDAISVEKILTTIPKYTDGSSHKLVMTILDDEAAEKFNEITGTKPTSTGVSSLSYKGWTIAVNINAY